MMRPSARYEDGEALHYPPTPARRSSVRIQAELHLLKSHQPHPHPHPRQRHHHLVREQAARLDYAVNCRAEREKTSNRGERVRGERGEAWSSHGGREKSVCGSKNMMRRHYLERGLVLRCSGPGQRARSSGHLRVRKRVPLARPPVHFHSHLTRGGGRVNFSM